MDSSVKTRLRDSELVPYIPVRMPINGANNISEIVMGPAASANAESGLVALLKELKYEPLPPIRPSTIPYRAL